MWWHTPVISASGRVEAGGWHIVAVGATEQIEGGLGYIVRFCL